MFGNNWNDESKPSLKRMDRFQTDDNNSRIKQVVDQIELAFISGKITGAMILNYSSQIQRAKITPLDDDPGEFEKCDNQNRLYPIAVSAWSNYWPARIRDWERSEFVFTAGDIYVADVEAVKGRSNIIGPLYEVMVDLKFSKDKEIVGNIIVQNADNALKSMVSIPAIPDKVDINRYQKYNNRLIDELIAAAWRAYAFDAKNEVVIKPRLFIKYMNDYLDAQNIDGDANKISTSLLNVIAAKLVDQAENRNRLIAVLLNSTPVKRS